MNSQPSYLDPLLTAMTFALTDHLQTGYGKARPPRDWQIFFAGNQTLNNGGCDVVKNPLAPAVLADYATAAALPLYNAVGGVLTAQANGPLTVDGVAMAATKVVLVKDEANANAPHNGLYVVTNPGAAGAPFVLTRTATPLLTDLHVIVGGGVANAGHGFALATPAPIVVETTALSFADLGVGSDYYKVVVWADTTKQAVLATARAADPAKALIVALQAIDPANHGSDTLTPVLS